MTTQRRAPRCWTDLLWSWLLPPHCLLCGVECAISGLLCAACNEELPRIRRACRRCARPLALPREAGDAAAEDGDGRLDCGACQLRPPPFRSSVIPYLFAAPLDQLLRQFKFDGKLEIGPLLATLVHTATSRQARPDLMIPVPLHSKRLTARGFNQALELARHLRRLNAVPFDYGTLVRVRHTEQQSALDRRARRRNVAGAFAARRRLDDLRVALIDDVVTTGATVTEAAAVLLDAGARSVEVWAVARTP